MTSAAFQKQVRVFREMLSSQLQQPTITATTMLTSNNLNPLISRIAQALNTGNVVLPSSAYVGMMQQELDVMMTQTSDNIRELVQQFSSDLSKRCRQQEDRLQLLKPLIQSNAPALDKPLLDSITATIYTEKSRSLTYDEAMNAFEMSLKETFDATMTTIEEAFHQESQSNPLTTKLLANVPSKLSVMRQDAMTLFTSKLSEVYTRLLSTARTASEEQVASLLHILQLRRQAIDPKTLDSEMSIVQMIGRSIAGEHYFQSSNESNRHLVEMLHASYRMIDQKMDTAKELIHRLNNERIDRDYQEALMIQEECQDR